MLASVCVCFIHGPTDRVVYFPCLLVYVRSVANTDTFNCIQASSILDMCFASSGQCKLLMLFSPL